MQNPLNPMKTALFLLALGALTLAGCESTNQGTLAPNEDGSGVGLRVPIDDTPEAGAPRRL